MPHLNTVSDFRPWRLHTLKVVWWPCLRPSPLGMGGLRRSVQTSPFARRTLDHFRRTLHDDSFYGRERHGKLFISAYIFVVLSHSFYYVAGPGQASSSSTWPSFSCSSSSPLTPCGGSREMAMAMAWLHAFCSFPFSLLPVL